MRIFIFYVVDRLEKLRASGQPYLANVKNSALPTYSSLVRTQLFLSFSYVSIKTPFLVTSNDTGDGMVDVVHEPIDDEQAEMHIWPLADFYGFGLEYAVPIHPIF